MIVTITGREQAFTKNGAEYLKLTGVDGAGKEITKSVFDHFKAQWESLQLNTTWEFKMEKKGQFWNITEIKPVDQAMKDAGKMPEKNHMVEEAQKLGAQVIPDKDEERIRSMALSYSKDLAVAGKIDLTGMRAYADKFVAYIKGVR